MKRSSKTLLFLASGLLASMVLSACGNSGGSDMSDEEKIKTMQKAHDVPLGGKPGGAAPAGGAQGNAVNPLAHP